MPHAQELATHGSSRGWPAALVTCRSKGADGSRPVDCHTAPKLFCSGMNEPCAHYENQSWDLLAALSYGGSGPHAPLYDSLHR